MKFVSIVFFLGWLLGGNVLSQELSYRTYSDEDDLYESLASGEISYYQYKTLLELLDLKIDSSDNHLWDEVPNHSSFQGKNPELLTPLQQEQQLKFTQAVALIRIKSDFSGFIKFREQFYIEEEPAAKYTAEYRLQYGDFKFRLNHRKEYSGRERFVNRSLTYKNSSTELIIGNFSKRLGLGTVLGYRGKLFTYSSQYDAESMLYPDYGGQNGFYYKKKFAQYELHSYFSQQRDDRFRLISSGLMLMYKKQKLKSSLIFGFNDLTNRMSNNHINLFNIAGYLNHRYRLGYLAFELTRQEGSRSNWAAAVIEGRHRYRQSEMKYALWHYDKNFIDLTSGSKSANLYKKITDESTEFSFSTRRSGQKGGMVKTIIELYPKLELSHAAIVGAISQDSLRWQLLSGLSYLISDDCRLSFDFLVDQTKKRGGSNSYDKKKRKSRLELQYRYQSFFIRSNVQFVTDESKPDYWIWQGRLRIEGTQNSQVEIWINLSEIDKSFKQIGRWYGYLNYEIFIFEKLKSGVKFNHRFSSRSAIKNRSQLSFELTAFL